MEGKMQQSLSAYTSIVGTDYFHRACDAWLAELLPYTEFTSECLRDFYERVARQADISYNVIGAKIRFWKKQGLIEPTGKSVCCLIPRTHQRRIQVWRKK